ncbi:outer membrane beta-barrel protein [Solimonas terrae]|uniref:Porin family protein n=1 Tax=Solimonas terrae TaxID=1396819 RepID=A0A6M2BUV1_9GAMM|nr:outer membrane beta-barrel protein [Solimonas terrae]NGY06164.1 porin family protein [Solimonas terrae]
MKMTIAALCCCAALVPLAAQAEGPYVGASGLYANRPGYDDVNGSFGGKVFAGYRFAPFPLFLEASYLNTGDADVDPGYDGNDRLKLNFSGYTIGAGVFWPLDSFGSGLWLRGSYYDGDTKLKTPDDPQSGSSKLSTSGGSFAVGADWKFSPWTGVRFEYEDLIEPEDFADNESIGMFSLGVIFDFPVAREPRGRRPY